MWTGQPIPNDAYSVGRDQAPRCRLCRHPARRRDFPRNHPIETTSMAGCNIRSAKCPTSSRRRQSCSANSLSSPSRSASRRSALPPHRRRHRLCCLTAASIEPSRLTSIRWSRREEACGDLRARRGREAPGSFGRARGDPIQRSFSITIVQGLSFCWQALRISSVVLQQTGTNWLPRRAEMLRVQWPASLASSLPSCDLPSTTSPGCSASISCASLSSTPDKIASRSTVRQLN